MRNCATYCLILHIEGMQNPDRNIADVTFAANPNNVLMFGVGSEEIVEYPPRLIVIQQQSATYNLFLVIFALDQRLTGDVIPFVDLRRSEAQMIRPTGGLMDAASRQPSEHLCFIENKLHRIIQTNAGVI